MGACKQNAFNSVCERNAITVRASIFEKAPDVRETLDSIVYCLENHQALDAKIELFFTGSTGLDENFFLQFLTALKDKDILGKVRRLSFEGAPINPDVIAESFSNFFGRIGDELWSLDRLPKQGGTTCYYPYRLITNPVTGQYCPEAVQQGFKTYTCRH